MDYLTEINETIKGGTNVFELFQVNNVCLLNRASFGLWPDLSILRDLENCIFIVARTQTEKKEHALHIHSSPNDIVSLSNMLSNIL